MEPAFGIWNFLYGRVYLERLDRHLLGFPGFNQPEGLFLALGLMFVPTVVNMLDMDEGLAARPPSLGLNVA